VALIGPIPSAAEQQHDCHHRAMISMHLTSALWTATGLLAGAIHAQQAGDRLLEVGIVFPRSDIYAPRDHFPFVYALQNAELAKELGSAIKIQTFIRNESASGSTFGHFHYDVDVNKANITAGKPYFVHRHLNVNLPAGEYLLYASLFWDDGYEKGCSGAEASSGSTLSVNFTIQNDGRQVDLVKATATEEGCDPEYAGLVIDVNPTCMPQVSSASASASASPSPTTTANPCRVQIEASVAESMAAKLKEGLCKGKNPPEDCPESAVGRLAVAELATLAAAFGAIGFVLLG